MKNTYSGSLAIKCPDCKYHFIERLQELEKSDRFYCPYCHREFPVGSSLIGEFRKEAHSSRFRF